MRYFKLSNELTTEMYRNIFRFTKQPMNAFYLLTFDMRKVKVPNLYSLRKIRDGWLFERNTI